MFDPSAAIITGFLLGSGFSGLSSTRDKDEDSPLNLQTQRLREKTAKYREETSRLLEEAETAFKRTASEGTTALRERNDQLHLEEARLKEQNERLDKEKTELFNSLMGPAHEQ